jgi:glutathione S-transferase
MHLFDYLDSGNGYKARLLLAQLGLEYRWSEVDIDAGETRQPEFLKRNPNGRIPTLELDDGTNLAESNAILWYLAEGTPFVPGDRLGRAQVLQWMFFEQYSHEPYVATPRYIVKHFSPDHARRTELPDRLAKGRAARLLRGRPLHDRRHRAVCVYACRTRRRPRPHAVSERALVARPRRRAARPRRHLRAPARLTYLTTY